MKSFRDWNGLLRFFLPDGNDKPKKMVLFCHGFPGIARLEKLRELLISRGIGWAETRYRGDPNYKGYFNFLAPLVDIVVAAQRVRERFPEACVSVIGYSYGGFCVLNILKFSPNSFDEVILLNPLLDTSFLKTEEMRRLIEDARYVIRIRGYDDHARDIEEISRFNNPKNFVSELELAIPVSLVLSQKDEVLPLSEAMDFYARLKVRNRRLTWIPEAGHELRGDEPELLEAVCGSW